MTTVLEGDEWSAARPGEDPVPIVTGAGWAPGSVWTGAENLAPPGVDPRTVQPVVGAFSIVLSHK